MNTQTQTQTKSNRAQKSNAWATLVLTDAERDILATAARSAAPDPYLAPSAFRTIAQAAWSELRSSTRDRFIELRTGASERPELHVQNLPLMPALPPTPLGSSWSRTTAGHFSELLMIAFTTELGYPISYADQRDGALFHDIYPTRANAAKVSSQSHRVGLGFHSEMFFHPTPPAFLLLHCLRPDPAGVALTSVADLATIERSLSSGDRTALRQPAYALDLARLHGSYTYKGRPITKDDPRPCLPVISSDDPATFRFEPALTTPTTQVCGDALLNAEHAAEATAVHGALRTGSLLIIDNRRAAHSRSSFPARFDGSDRWLRRMMVAASPADLADGVVRSENLDLFTPWQDAGASFAHVPYVTNCGGQV